MPNIDAFGDVNRTDVSTFGSRVATALAKGRLDANLELVHLILRPRHGLLAQVHHHPRQHA